jgi:hypothetical protein
VTSWTLISLEPYDRIYDSAKPHDGIERLYGFTILGRLPLTDSQVAIDAVEKIAGTVRPDNTKCDFEPRHALTGQMADGRKLEMLLDYEDGVLILYMDGLDKNTGDFYFTPADPKSLNDLLRANGVPLQRQP